jgi:RNA polymerase-binding transcription factor DksA
MATTAPAAPGGQAKQALGRELQAERARLVWTLRANAEAERALGESQDGGGGWGQEACVASALVAEELLAALDHEERARLTDVEAALRRLARGRYGLCEGCGRPIPPARLQAVPWARQCVGCAGRLETGRPGSGLGRRTDRTGRRFGTQRPPEGGQP